MGFGRLAGGRSSGPSTAKEKSKREGPFGETQGKRAPPLQMYEQVLRDAGRVMWNLVGGRW